ncbi:Apoptotic ATPase [Handroanthus impetiginosus]|uniref:Apoptotic ATPase n=1 Tax=Handroanthus impetiginosus TaxID=429701 RepID=A0A2G9GSE2_9LAMI|nr:Apoptotic ATPase [Handroanthus impetiginosus]
MADVVVSAVINKAIDMGANMIMEEGSRLDWLDDVEWLKREMKHMQGYLKNAEAKKFTNLNVTNLIKDIGDLVHDAEDILDIYCSYQVESDKSNGVLKRMSTCFLPCGRTSSMFSREIEKIRRRVEGIDTSKLIKEHPFVSIVGMPGLGKTTLAKQVFKDIKDDFDCCASVAVSQEPNITSLARDVANQMGVTQTDENMEVNMYTFLQGKRYVVFLDDIWDIKAWDSLRACFPIDFGSASRMIITFRNSDVGRYIGGENSLHELHPFDNSKSWELFSKLIIPLSIVVLVGMLRERGMSEFCWKCVLHGIGENTSDQRSQILDLSYRDLPTFLKPCFLHFGIFPGVYEFSKSQIIRLRLRARGCGRDYISKLEARNLIQVVKIGHDGRVKKFRIHDLLHSFCVNMDREVDFLDTIDHLESSAAKGVRRLCVHYHSFVAGNEYVPFQMGSLSRLKYLQIDSLNQVKIPSSILDLRNLQTLDFRGCQFAKLPIGIWKMEQLRHFLLDDRYVNYHVMILLCHYQQQVQVFLPNLQTLVGVWCSDLKPIWLQKLTNLRKLKLRLVTPEIIEVLCGPEPISKKLETFCCWGIRCFMTRRVSLAKYERLMKLKLRSVEMQQLPELPPSLIKLTLEWTKLIENPMKILKNLPKLKILHRNEYSYTVEVKWIAQELTAFLN